MFFSIIWPNYSRLLSKQNKSTQNLCGSMCACTHKHIQDFVYLVRGRKDIKPPNISSWWQRVLQGQHLCSRVRAVPKPGGRLPQLKLDSNVRNSNETEVCAPVCADRARPTREAVPTWKLYGHVNMASLHRTY